MTHEKELELMKLKDKVRKLLSAQKEYYRTKDKQKLMIAKSYEKEVAEIIDPPVKAQQSLFNDWLAQ